MNTRMIMTNYTSSDMSDLLSRIHPEWTSEKQALKIWDTLPKYIRYDTADLHHKIYESWKSPINFKTSEVLKQECETFFRNNKSRMTKELETLLHEHFKKYIQKLTR